MKRNKCYIYTRVSTVAQTEGFSLEAQQERLKEFANYKNLEIAGEYCDAGKSGKSIVMIFPVRRTGYLMYWCLNFLVLDVMRQIY